MKRAVVLMMFMFAALNISLAVGNHQIKYRIQCATSADKDLMDKLSDIPELKTFTLPSGSKIYFSGGYFNKFQTAQQRLEEVKSKGIKKAFIRVFKYNNMLSRPVGDQYIVIAKNKIKLEESKSKDSSNVSSTTISSKPATTQKLYSRAEIEALKKKAAEKKAAEAAKVAAKEKARKEAVVKKEVEVAKEEEKKKPKSEITITEPPVFKIMLGKSDGSHDQFEAVSKLNNEIIYTYEDRNEIIYAIGFYKDETEANKSLPGFKKSAKEAKVIGLYKGKVISLKLANQLLAQYNSQNN